MAREVSGRRFRLFTANLKVVRFQYEPATLAVRSTYLRAIWAGANCAAIALGDNMLRCSGHANKDKGERCLKFRRIPHHSISATPACRWTVDKSQASCRTHRAARW
jgi:hypothetical protein